VIRIDCNPPAHCSLRYRCYEAIEVPPHGVCLVLEYADDGDLASRITHLQDHKQTFPEETVMLYLVQIVQALQYLHSQGIVHRDIKTANIFLMKPGLVKIGDFGTARELEDRGEEDPTKRTCHTPVGTPSYMSPELCMSAPYGPKSDMWALGCVLFEVCMLYLSNCLRVDLSV
jgi:NIMA (never in mitosis gene a)-related kinase